MFEITTRLFIQLGFCTPLPRPTHRHKLGIGSAGGRDGQLGEDSRYGLGEFGTVIILLFEQLGDWKYYIDPLELIYAANQIRSLIKPS
jgi:hypothetical protein